MNKHSDDIIHKQPALWLSFTEAVLIPVFITMLGFIFNSGDPLFIASPFPWLLAGPLLAGMRYGSSHGLLASGVAVALIIGYWQLGYLTALPFEQMIGFILTGLVCGELADLWLRRLGRLEVLAQYQQRRLNEFTRSHQLLRISHKQLEAQLMGQRHNLRSALEQLAERGQMFAGEPNILGRFGADVLQFFSIYGMVNEALLYKVEGKTIQASAVAQLGCGKEINSDHPMIKHCIQERRLVSLRDDDPLNHRDSDRILAVIPLVDVQERVWGVIPILDMPFHAYHNDNLSVLAVMAAAVGDLISDLHEPRYARSPNQRHQFSRELDRWISYSRRYALPTTLVSLRLDKHIGAERRELINAVIYEQLRGLDKAMNINHADGGSTWITLLPLTDLKGAQAFQQRIKFEIEALLHASEAHLVSFETNSLGRRTALADELYTQLQGAA